MERSTGTKSERKTQREYDGDDDSSDDTPSTSLHVLFLSVNLSFSIIPFSPRRKRGNKRNK